MTDSDLTLKVLVEMRDEMRTLRNEAKETNRQLGELSGEVRGTNQRLDLIEHTMVEYRTQLVMLGRYMKNTASGHDEEISDLRIRVEKLETKS